MVCSAVWPRTPLRKGFELFWLPKGSPVLLSDLLCAHSPGFAKKTFISYTVTFKENFRQGLVVDIDLQNQTVLLEDGEVSMVGADPSCLREEPRMVSRVVSRRWPPHGAGQVTGSS